MIDVFLSSPGHFWPWLPPLDMRDEEPLSHADADLIAEALCDLVAGASK